MIRALLLFWLLPLGFFWSWYFLSLNDINFGTLFFSRPLHDHVFAIYGSLLGVEPELLPAMIAKALFVDSSIVAAVIAFRQRRRIAAWLGQAPVVAGVPQEPFARSDDSRSSAP
ncbi:DUF6105 family protein [Mangrovicella endophytica]|uniref:DUF6105 family protein n=1 Tax=Mangrovicella endophytica TaxID=2066697 RepID=UPI0018E48924|nr:DUF6105 family protein [Mangrovicella endophytica]